MDVLVTGATGFVGANVARLLVADGYRVRVLARPASSLQALSGCRVEIFRGDILDPHALAPAVRGCAIVFHVAADYRLWAKDPHEIYRNNVDGTRTVLEACERADVGRVVYTSSVGTLGIPKDGRPGTEATPVALEDMIGSYKRSKFLAERVAEEFAARGHLLAARLGRIGEKYILGAENLSLSEIFRTLEGITGIRAPRIRMPYGLVYLVALASEGLARATGRPPRVPLTGVRMARKHMYFSADKAVRELGFFQRPVEQALRDAVDWFVDYGYASPPPRYMRQAA